MPSQKTTLSASLVKASPVLATTVMLALTLAPVNLFLLVFVALVPWLSSLRQPDSNWKRSGVLFGFLFFGLHMLWLLPFVGRWTGSYGLASVPWLLGASLQVPYFVILSGLVWACYRRGAPWAIPFVWAAVEFGRSMVPVLGFPNGLLATPLAVTPQLIQTAALGTVFFVSAWAVLFNVAMVELLERAHPRMSLGMASIFVAFGLFSYARHGQMPTGELRTVSVGQLGTDLAFGDPATEPHRISDAVLTLGAQATVQNADLLLLPEGLGPAGSQADAPNVPFPLPPVPVLFGMQRGTGPIYQSAFAFDGSWKHVDKTRLVVFGEFVPFRDQLPFLKSFNLPTGDMRPGEKTGLLNVNRMRIGPVICFEAMFPDVAQKQAEMGAQMFAVMSIDDWFMGSSMPDQLWAASVFRAVENGLPLARSATLGYSGWIDARGNTRVRLPIGVRRTVRAEITLPPQSDAVPGRQFFPWVAVLVSLLVLALPVRTPKQRTESSEES